MESVQWNNILPLVILSVAAILALLIIAVRRNHLLINALTLGAFVIAIFSVFGLPEKATPDTLFNMDGFGAFFIILILVASAAITLLSYAYLEKREENKEEYYVMILLGAAGASALAIANHFVSFFLGLELLSVSLYVMIGYLRVWESSIEAAIKYLILAGVSAAFLLMGMSLLYFQGGSMEFSGIANQLANAGFSDPLVLTGIGMMTVGVGFKMAVVPFHLWTPDVYEGAPAPTSAFIASVSKGGVIALWVRFFTEMNGYEYGKALLIFSVIAIASMLIGNLLALLQKNVKRILAYSSIAHLGYVLVAFVSGGERGVEAVAFYMLAYFVTILAAFGIVAHVSGKERDAYKLEDYQGLFWKKPALAAAFTATLLSLAGIPLTAGFIGKYYVLMAGVFTNHWLLAVTLVTGSVIGLFYYLRIIVEMFKKPADVESAADPVKGISLGGGLVIAVLIILVVWFGVYPASLVEAIGALSIGG